MAIGTACVSNVPGNRRTYGYKRKGVKHKKGNIRTLNFRVTKTKVSKS